MKYFYSFSNLNGKCKTFCSTDQGLKLIRLNYNAPLKPIHIKRSIYKRLERNQLKVTKPVNCSWFCKSVSKGLLSVSFKIKLYKREFLYVFWRRNISKEIYEVYRFGWKCQNIQKKYYCPRCPIWFLNKTSNSLSFIHYRNPNG